MGQPGRDAFVSKDFSDPQINRQHTTSSAIFDDLRGAWQFPRICNLLQNLSAPRCHGSDRQPNGFLDRCTVEQRSARSVDLNRRPPGAMRCRIPHLKPRGLLMRIPCQASSGIHRTFPVVLLLPSMTQTHICVSMKLA